MDKRQELDRIAQASIAAHREMRSKLFLEAAIAGLLEIYSISDVAEMLRAKASHLDEFS
jgi:hypothetical protein